LWADVAPPVLFFCIRVLVLFVWVILSVLVLKIVFFLPDLWEFIILLVNHEVFFQGIHPNVAHLIVGQREFAVR